MSQLKLNNYLASLQRQIDRSVANIKNKTATNNRIGKDFNQAEEDRYPYSKIDNHTYKLLETKVSYQLSTYSSQNPQPSDSVYASESYKNAENIIKEPTILIDYMFEYNREFNFKV